MLKIPLLRSLSLLAKKETMSSCSGYCPMCLFAVCVCQAEHSKFLCQHGWFGQALADAALLCLEAAAAEERDMECVGFPMGSATGKILKLPWASPSKCVGF